MQRLIINVQGKRLDDMLRLLRIPTTRTATARAISQMMQYRLSLSSFTTAPQTFKVYGEKCPDYEQWLCDQLNMPVTRIIYYPGKYPLTELEIKASEIRSGEKRPLREIYSIYRENCERALAYVVKHAGVASASQWMERNLGLKDKAFSQCSVTCLNTETCNYLVNLDVDTNEYLSPWVSNVKKWLEYNGISCSMILKGGERQGVAPATNISNF